MPQKTITQVIDAMQWKVSGDDAEAATETRKRAVLSGPDAVALLHFVVITDKFASVSQRVRAASVLLDVGGFTTSEPKETGLFREPEETDAVDEREEA